jgi:hypothetical protein
MDGATRILFLLGSCGKLQAHGIEELVEVIGDALIEVVELGTFGLLGVAGDGVKQTGGERCVYSFEELEEDYAQGVALGA